MATVINVRESSTQFDLTLPDSLADVGVDGVSQALYGFPTSKVIFHVLTPPKDNVEQRKAILSLSISTLALMQFCQQTLKAFVEGSAQVESASAEYAKQLKDVLDGIQVKPKQV